MGPRLAALLSLLLAAAWSCAPARAPRIGVSVATMREAVYSFMQQEMVERHAADRVELIWLSADNSAQKQKADVGSLIEQGVDVLILHPVDAVAAADLAQAAFSAGIPVIAMDRLPAGAYVRLYVTADSRRAGQLQAQALAQRLGGKGNVLILEGEAGNFVAEAMTRGNLEVLARYPDLRLLMRRTHAGWSRDLARQTTREAYALHPDGLQGVLANNSAMAMGALDAAQELGVARPALVVGADADRDACEALAAGRLAADIDKMPAEIGRAAYEAALSVIRRRPLAIDAALDNGGVSVEVKLTPVKLLTRDNVRQEMEYRWGKL